MHGWTLMLCTSTQVQLRLCVVKKTINTPQQPRVDQGLLVILYISYLLSSCSSCAEIIGRWALSPSSRAEHQLYIYEFIYFSLSTCHHADLRTSDNSLSALSPHSPTPHCIHSSLGHLLVATKPVPTISTQTQTIERGLSKQEMAVLRFTHHGAGCMITMLLYQYCTSHIPADRCIMCSWNFPQVKLISVTYM